MSSFTSDSPTETPVVPAASVSAPVLAAPNPTSLSASSSATSQREYTRTEVTAWASRVKHIQLERCTPEIRQRLEEQALHKTYVAKAVGKASRLQRCNLITSASNATALDSFSKISAAPRSAPSAAADYTMTSTIQSNQASKVRQVLEKKSLASKSKAGGGESGVGFMAQLRSMASGGARHYIPDESEDADEEEADRDMAMLEQEIVSANPRHAAWFGGGVAMAAQATVEATAEVAELLKQLKVEPRNDAELAAKFQLFENFLETVTAIRTTTLAFWDDNNELFTQATMRAAAQRDVTNIDSVDAISIPDDPSVWFAYWMLQKANQNSVAINQLLASLKTRLELLAQELGECPICLEQMAADSNTVLGCAHRVCTPCWTQYVHLVGRGHPKCPLCRHDEFVQDIVEQAP